MPESKNILPQSAEEVPIVNLGGTALNLPKTPIVGDYPANGIAGKSLSPDDMFLAQARGGGRESIPVSSFYTGGDRYDATRPFTDFEEMAANNQGTASRWINGITKGVGLAATTFASGTVGLMYGMGSSIVNQRLADLIDNDVTRAMDETNKRMEDALPNYYSHAEQDAAWYSGNNILSANFWADKVIKNLGFSLGAIGGGMVWSKAFKLMGATNALVKAGYGLEAATAVEEAMATAPKAQKFAAFENAMSSLSQKYIKSPLAAGLKNSDRILTSVMGTFGEASMEGLQNMNDFRNKAIQEFRDTHGYDPEGADLEEINKYADSVGLSTFAANTLLLSATNYIQLPKILGSSKSAERAMINGIEQEGIGGAFTQALPTTKFGKVLNSIKGLGRYAFAPSEAFEEGAQYAIQKGVDDYFSRAYTGKQDAKDYLSTVGEVMGNIFSFGADKALTDKEGLESILIGGLSGGLQQARGTYKEYGLFGTGGERGANTQAALAALNKTNINKVLTDQGNYIARGVASQKLRQQAIAANDTLSEKDFEHDFVMSYLMPRIKYGKVDGVNLELSYYENQAMSDEGFDQLVTAGIASKNETREQFLTRISNLKATAKSVNELYNVVNDRYGGIFTTDGKRVYDDEVVDKMVYTASKIRDYDKRIPSLAAELTGIGIDGLQIISDIAEGKPESYVEAMKKIDELGNANNPNSKDADTIEDYKRKLEDLAELGLRRRDMVNTYAAMKVSPDSFKTTEPVETTIPEGAEKQVIKVKTKKGDINITVGEEYYLGRVVEYDKDGKEVYRFPKLTILGQNADGTIKIKDSNGVERDIDPEVLADYSLGRISELAKNKTANYYFNHINDVFEYNFGKDFGGKRRGRLTYDPNKNQLFFVYKDANGKTKTKLIDNTHFVAQQGFNQARIKKVTTLKALSAQQRQAQQEFISQEEIAKAKQEFEKKMAARRAIIEEVASETRERLDSINKKLLAKREKLAEVMKDMEELAEFRVKDKYSNVSIVSSFNKILKNSMATLRDLSQLRSSLEKEIAELEAHKDELEFNLSYMEDLKQNLTELPEDFNEFLSEIKSQVSDLEDLTVETGKQINELSKALDIANATMLDYIKLLKEAISKFNADYPQALKDKFEEIRNKKTVSLEDLAELKDLITDATFLEDLKKEVSINEEKVKELSSKIDELYKKLDDIGQRQTAMEAIVKKFDEAVAKYKAAKAEEERLKRDEEMIKQVLGTMGQGILNREYERKFEADPKKSNTTLVKSTVVPTARSFEQEGEQQMEHQLRSNRFGVRFPNLPNSANIKGTIVTNATQNQLIPGLTEFLARGKREVDPTKTIVMVMTENGKLVDEFGKPIAEKQEGETDEAYNQRLLDSAVFQVFPINIDNLFRETTTEEEKKFYKDRYRLWRDQVLAGNTVSSYTIQASFGTPETVKEKDENGVDKDAAVVNTPVSEAGLIDENKLGSTRMIKIPTVEERISLGSTSYGNAKGRVFLITNAGYVPLQNRKHTAKEAETIYKAIHRLATIMFEKNKEGKFVLQDSPEAMRLVDWLRTVTYWGGPNEEGYAGYNSVWFQKTDAGFHLYMSGKQDEQGNYTRIAEFTPSSLDENKNSIQTLLQNMYANTNAKLTDTSFYNQRYEQITDITEDGEIQSIVWPNYQSYLLSTKMPDENGKLTKARKQEEVPLTTTIRPLANENDTNRNGVYFTIVDKSIDDRYIDSTPTGTAVQPTAPVAQAAPKTEEITGKFNLDGKTDNTIELSKLGGKLTFTYTYAEGLPPGNLQFTIDGAVVENFNKTVTPEKLAEFKATLSPEEQALSEEELKKKLAESAFGTYIMNQIKADVEQVNQAKEEAAAKQAAAQPVAPAPTAPVSDIEAKIKAFDKTIEPEFEEGDYVKVLSLAQKQVENGTIDQTPENLQLLANYPGLFEELIKATEARNKTIAEFDKEAVLVGRPKELPIYGIEAEVNPATGKLNIKWVVVETRPITNIQTIKLGNYAANVLFDYKNELAALQGTKPTETTEEKADETIDEQWEKDSEEAPDDPELRVVLREQMTNYTPENWNDVEKAIGQMFPNIPVYRVKNILAGANGLQAWGMVKDGAIYLYENAEVGTAYHEIFEAVWKMSTTQKEQNVAREEFRSRPGSFVDRPTGETIEYKNATNQQIKEQLAEEFRSFIKDGTLPPAPGKIKKSIIRTIFEELRRLIDKFFRGIDASNNTERLFKRIGKGYYKTVIPGESALSYSKVGILDIDNVYIDGDYELREVPNLSNTLTNDVMQQMTFLSLGYIMKDGENLFNVSTGGTRVEVYGRVQENIRKRLASMGKIVAQDIKNGNISEEAGNKRIAAYKSAYADIIKNWDDLVAKHEIYLKKYDVQFDENDEISMKDENNTGKGEFDASHKIDYFRKLNPAIKLLVSTLPITNSKGEAIRTSIGGVTLIPTSEAYMSLMNTLNGSLDASDMVERLRDMAKDDPNYRLLFQRLTKVDYTSDVNWDNLSKNDVMLLTAFYNSFNKQAPDFKIFNILAGGGIQVGEANLSTAARQIKSQFTNAIKLAITTPSNKKYFEYNKKEKAYIGTKKEIVTDTLDRQLAFLKDLNIEFSKDELNQLEVVNKKLYMSFGTAVNGIAESIRRGNKLVSLGGKALDIDGRLYELANIRAKLDNPEFSSTFIGINGEKMQTYMGVNPSSELYKHLSQLTNFQSLKGHPTYGYLYTDSFARNSVLLNAIFNIDYTTMTGDRRDVAETKEYLKAGVANGMNNQTNGKKKESAKLNTKERFVQEINMNEAGWYYNLVAGDASLEHMMYMGNHITTKDLARNYDDVHRIFRGYLIDEINLAREKRPVAKDRQSNDLRFMRAILGDKLTNDILADTRSAEEIADAMKDKVNSAVTKFIQEKAKGLESTLRKYGVIYDNIEDGGLTVENMSFAPGEKISEENLKLALEANTVNFMIANIEFHKILYSDPYQYSDELKRIKNFLSPRQALINGSAEMNSAMNRVWNEGYNPGDLGHVDFTKETFNTATIEDVVAISENQDYDAYKETDGGGIISMGAYKNFRVRTSSWSDNDEAQYRHDVEYERLARAGATEEELAKFDEKNPGVKSAYTPIKPIVAGNKWNGKNYNDVVLDKFALYPMSYRIMKKINPTANAFKLLDRMAAQKIDYVVFESGRKVGGGKPNPVYNAKGEFVTAPFENVMNVPLAIMSVQAEVPSKEEELVTRGSQMTKLVTMDFMEAGVPIDFQPEGKFADRYEAWYKLTEDQRLTYNNGDNLYKEIKNNQDLLEELMEIGFNELLEKVGISIVDGKFQIDNSKAAEAIREEILGREVNSNIIAALDAFVKGSTIIEATPAYQQVRNILYAMADKSVISPKMPGGQLVQIPSTFMETNRVEKKTINGKTGYTSDVLGFYIDEDGKRVCEVMIGRKFDTNLSDEELLAYLNDENNPEAKKIRDGIGYRIPTQKQNSIDRIVIKKFLPKEFADSVVVPSALVAKVGSDFDIDKLSVYLRNLYTDAKGYPKVVPYFGKGEQAKAKFKDMYFDILEMKHKETEKKIVSNANLQALFGELSLGETTDKTREKWIPIFKEMFKDELVDGKLPVDRIEQIFINRLQKLGKKIEKMSDYDIQEVLSEEFADKMYKQSIQNQYIESLEKLVSHPLNYEQLVKANSAEQLKALAKRVALKTTGTTFDYQAVGNMLDRNFMTSLRHAFVSGKYAIGIAAIAQTNHSLNQRQPIYVDKDRIAKMSDPLDRFYLSAGNGDVNFKRYNKLTINGKVVPTLSMIKSANERDNISDILGQFIDGYVDISKGPWIIEMGASPNVASTFMFLVKLGVPIEDVVFFMNQPIIRDYTQMVENAGYSYLFIDDFMDNMMDKYASKGTETEVTSIPSATSLEGTMGMDVSKMSPEQKLEQRFMLKEFLKYAKMSEQLLHVTQGTNFDTASFNDPYLVFKKMEQLKRAKESIVTSADELLNNSFMGKLSQMINNVRNAYGQILASDRGRVRVVLENVLRPYVNLQDRDFLKVSQKAVTDLFDYVVQIDNNRNSLIQSLLLDDTGATKQVFDYVQSIKNNPSHPLVNNHVVKILGIDKSDRIGGANNLFLNNKDNKVYDQDNIISAFRELRDYMINVDNNPNLYKKLVGVSILQSGLSSTRFSFTTLLPYEDFAETYSQALYKIDERTDIDLNKFYELGVFQRNNWNNDDIVPYERARYINATDFMGRRIYNINMKFGGPIVKAMDNGEINQLVKMSIHSQSGKSDYIVYTWEDRISPEEKARRRKEGDFGFIHRGLFKKVYLDDDNKVPAIDTYYSKKKNKLYESFVYQKINAWGDGYRANEFYNVERQSVIENGFEKVAKEIDTKAVAKFYATDVMPSSTIVDKAEQSMNHKTDPKYGVTSEATTANEESLKAQIASLEEKMKTTGLGPAEMSSLQALQTELGKIIKSKC